MQVWESNPWGSWWMKYAGVDTDTGTDRHAEMVAETLKNQEINP